MAGGEQTDMVIVMEDYVTSMSQVSLDIFMKFLILKKFIEFMFLLRLCFFDFLEHKMM